jgi:probable F420-dependent oxidoreductase
MTTTSCIRQPLPAHAAQGDDSVADTKPFRFGVTLFPTTSSRRAWTDSAKRVVALGYSALTVTDHFGNAGGPWSALVAAHDAAPSLRLGTLMLNNDLWNPAVLAREAITADVMTEGQLEIGLGAGWDEPDYRSAGLVRAPASVRIARLAETIEILRQAWSGQVVKYSGAHYDVAAKSAWPKPMQTRLPLVIGGGGRRILELAAKNADTVSVHRNLDGGVAASWREGLGATAPQADVVSQRIEWIRAAAGERFAALELHAIILRATVTEKRLEIAGDLARPLGLRAEDLLGSPHFLIGTVDEMVADLLERRRRWGFSYWTIVPAGDVEPFAQVVSRLSGK